MSSDPYGFPEAAPTESDVGDPRRSLWLGIGALSLGALAPCCCSIPWVGVFPLACAALYYGTRAAKRGEQLSEGDRNANQAGIVSGAVALGLSMLWGMLLLFYAVYFVLMVGLIGLGNG